jgi:Ca-activated chloride channel family protein
MIARISDALDQQAQAAGSGAGRIAPPPAYPKAVFGLTLPNVIPPERVSIAVDLESALPIGEVASATHALSITGEGGRRRIALARGRTVDNRDFTLRYTLAGGAVQTGALTHADARGGFFSLLIEPPAAPQANAIAAREIVFVLDTSGSMQGEPIEASKAFMRRALATLRSNDYFRIVQFNYTPREFSAGPVPATRENIARGQRFVAGLAAGGGTEVASAMQQAFSVPQQPNTLRLVVFLSDGYIGNEAEILGDLARMIGDARVYAFGVGSSVNRYLLSEMARRGRGFARYIDPTETSHQAALELAGRLETPLLTDISIDWGGLNPEGVSPNLIPDLFAGDSLRVLGRFTGSREATVTIAGKANGRPVSFPVRLRLAQDRPNAGRSGAAIPIAWARSQIADLMADYTTPPELRTLRLSEDGLKERVIRLGLDYSLVTDWTSFVAVSNRIVNNDPDAAKDASIPLPMPEGVGPNAYGGEVYGLMPSSFGGASAPEPGVLALIALLLSLTLVVGLRLRARRSA